ncbi:MAG: MBL fold metallo-hydrolase [Proteobacteria bacterium]|nr:MBL fold metallo-hydrolase [Pseudomonadota bacterium]MBU1711206.1 MBL fold metallo-hydrolase [Pseudomonadota bacterium]
MRFCVLGSGSKGNSTFIESGETRILIDSGFSGKETARRLAEVNVDIALLSGIIVTHEHTDHVKGVSILSRRYKLPVFATAATFAAAMDLKSSHACHEISPGTAFSLENLVIHPFAISHDAADPVGFVVSNNLFSLGYCTDTGVVSRLMQHRLSSCHGLILECNHDPEMLKTGPYPEMLKQRVRSKVGHLANAEAVNFLRELLHENMQYVVLAHISETNNHPEKVQQTLAEIINTDNGPDPRISLAHQDRPGKMFILKGSPG